MASKSSKAKRARVSMTSEAEGPFARVWAIVKRIPPGRVTTYGQIAEMIDKRLSPVGVGWAIRAAGEGRIPWHRVLNSKGTVSTDGAHPGLQRAMLEAEGVVFDEDGAVDLARVQWRPRR
ncbi:MAG: MGMT family protein [Labilithrix sp.]|nr:MGMT family protein [Labilithrix sp.]MBX3222298.1 MGMT family protein [Labilithrix sp.]